MDEHERRAGSVVKSIRQKGNAKAAFVILVGVAQRIWAKVPK
jgi:hypothetical protein